VIPGIDRTRKHHAIEHATIAVLLERNRRPFSVLGRSDPGGFHLYSPFGPDEVESALGEAMERLRGGEGHLAVTNNCGTNIVATGVLAGLAAVIGVGRGPDRNWPRAVVAAILGTIAAAPAGRWIQRHLTTDVEIADVVFESTREYRRRGRLRHLRIALKD
jgi:hypothetical protein